MMNTGQTVFPARSRHCLTVPGGSTEWSVNRPELASRMMFRQGCSMSSLAILTTKTALQVMSELPKVLSECVNGRGRSEWIEAFIFGPDAP